jgi:hypothetical protein
MGTATLAICIYLALTAACAVSLWLFLSARRELNRLRRGTHSTQRPGLIEEVLRLRSAGLDAARIAKQVRASPAEVRFILDLEQARAQRTTTLAAA